jgi:broad specificity phosphatase PhoE
MIPNRPFFMIRHGESEANFNRKMAGSLDSPLTELGKHQAAQAGFILEQLEIKPKLIFHSNLQRARHTAEIINKNLKLPMTEDKDLAEMHVGQLEGAPWESCRDCFDGWVDPPDGETFQGFFERIKRAKKKALESTDGPILIVSHGGVFKALWKIYGHDMPGVKNCHLHEFSPLLTSAAFPWQTHYYDYDQKVIRTEAIYHKDDTIA